MLPTPSSHWLQDKYFGWSTVSPSEGGGVCKIICSQINGFIDFFNICIKIRSIKSSTVIKQLNIETRVWWLQVQNRKKPKKMFLFPIVMELNIKGYSTARNHVHSLMGFLYCSVAFLFWVRQLLQIKKFVRMLVASCWYRL